MPEAVIAPVSAPDGTAGRVISGTACRISEAGPTGMITLRAGLADGAVADALPAAGVSMPARLGVTASEGRAAVWMSPDELLLVLPYADAPAAAAALRDRLAGQHATVVEVSHARVLFRLEGPGAGEVLAKGAPLDFRDAAFPPGTARRTHLGQIAVAIWRESPDAWFLVCFRSVSDFVADWLAASAAPGFEVGHF